VPVVDGLVASVQRHGLHWRHFHDLLDAFLQDLRVTRYDTVTQVQDYCSRSANPVGRLLLQLYGVGSDTALAQSDAICSALQRINFLQDIGIDAADTHQRARQRRRLHLPKDRQRGRARQRLGARRKERPERQIVGHWCQCPGPLHAGIARHTDQRPGPQRPTGLLDIAVVLTQMHGINAQLGGQLPVIVHDQQCLMAGTDAFQGFQLLPLQRPVGMLVAVLQDADAA